MVFSGGGGGFDLGSAYGKIVLSLDDSAVQNARQSIGGGLQDLGGAISSIGSSLTQLTAPVLTFGLTGLKAASDFNAVNNEIRIFGELSPPELEKVRQAALKFGADTKYSALDASNAMLDLLKSGMDMTSTLATMPAVLNLAAAGNINLAQSAGVVTSALAQFRLGADEAGRVSDALSRGASASRANVSDLGMALNNVGPIAAQFGLSVEDTTAILSVFAQNGIMGAEAGTQLKSMLVNLNRPTDDVKAAFARLGVSLYDNQGRTRNFNTVLLELKAGLEKLPVQQQNELMQVLAGTYGLTGLNALMASDGIGSMLEQMDKAPDAATIAAEQMNTFEGKVESLMGSIQTLQIEALTPLMDDALAPLVDQLIGVVNGITKWIDENPELAGQIIQILAVIAIAGPILLAVGLAISAVGTALSGLGILLSGPLLPLALVVGALILLADHFNITWGQIQVYGSLIALYAEYYFGKVVTAIQDVIGKVSDFITANPEFIVALGAIGLAVILPTVLVSAFGVVVGLASTAVGLLTGALALLFSPVVLVALAIGGLLYAINELYPGGISGVLRDAGKAAQDLAGILKYNLGEAARWIQDRIADFQVTLHNLLIEYLRFTDSIVNNPFMQSIVPGLKQIADLWNQSKAAMQGYFTAQYGFDPLTTKYEYQQNDPYNFVETRPGRAPASAWRLPEGSQGGGASFRDSGGPGFADMRYLIGPSQTDNEIYVPRSDGQFIPNFMDTMKQMAGAGGEGTRIDTLIIYANSRAEGQAAADGFEERILERKRARGL